MGEITGRSTVTGIIGHPIAHSLSPVMHNAAFAELGLDWIFVPFAVEPGRLGQAVEGLRALGVAGYNVTIPHKVAVMEFLDRISPEAELIGAVNTVRLADGVLTGHNTDGIGFLASLETDLGLKPAGLSVLVLGAGGAARSALVALGLAGTARIALCNRSGDKAAELAGELAPRLPGCELAAHPAERLADPGFVGSFDLLVNTTSVGMRGDWFPGLTLPQGGRGPAVYDMVYAPPVTPLLARAGELGLPAANGLGMLVAQGEAAFRIWTGVQPPQGCMAAALARRAAVGKS